MLSQRMTGFLGKMALCLLLCASSGLPLALRPHDTHAAHAAALGKGISDTDVWVRVDAPTGGSQRLHLYAHSVGLFACSATITASRYGGIIGHFEGFNMANKDGALTLDGVLSPRPGPGRYWVLALCSYPIPGHGSEPTATFATSFVLPRRAPTPTPPPPLQVWIDPAQGSMNAPITLYAKTNPGVLCSAYLLETDGWATGHVVRVGRDGIASWTWTYQYGGTGYVTCDNRDQYARAQVDY